MNLDPKDHEVIEAIAQRVVELMQAQSAVLARDVLTAGEAAEYVGKPSVEALYHWGKKWGVRPCAHGRYSLRALKAGLEREARKSYEHTSAAGKREVCHA